MFRSTPSSSCSSTFTAQIPAGAAISSSGLVCARASRTAVTQLWNHRVGSTRFFSWKMEIRTLCPHLESRKGSHSTVFSEKLCLHEEVSTYRSLCMPQWLEYPGLSPQPGPRALVRHKPYRSTNLMEIFFFSTLTKSISSKDSN